MITKKIITGITVTMMGVALMGVANAAPMQYYEDFKAKQAQVQVLESSDKSDEQGALQFEMPGPYMNQSGINDQDKNNNSSTSKQNGQFNMGAQMDYDTMQQNHDSMVTYMNNNMNNNMPMQPSMSGAKKAPQQVQMNGNGMTGGSRGSMGSVMGSSGMGM